MVHQSRSVHPERWYKAEYDDASILYQDSSFQDPVSESKYRDKYESDHISLGENSSSVLDYESFRSKLRSVTSSFSCAKDPYKKSAYKKNDEMDKPLDSRDTGETESQTSDSQRDHDEEHQSYQSRKEIKSVNHNVYSDETTESHFLRPDKSGASKARSVRESKEKSLATFGKVSVRKGGTKGRDSITKDSISSFVSSSHISTAESSIDSSNRSNDVCRAPTRGKTEKAKGIMEVARGIFRARSRKAPSSIRASSEKRKPSSMSSSQLRTAVKLQLLMKAKQEEEDSIRHPPRKESISPSVWGGMSRGSIKKVSQRGRTKSTRTKQTSNRPPITQQQRKSRQQTEQSKIGKGPGNRRSNKISAKRTEVDNDDSGDRSLFDSIYDAFGNWSRHESRDRMSAYENSRLGDVDGSIATSRRRLEIPPEKTIAQEDLSQTPSVLEDESVTNEFEETETKAELTVVASVAEAWDEIMESAAIIARHYEVDWRGESESIRMKEGEDFREAMKIFREHAKRLNIDPNDLFAAVREDASLHENSTSDDDETIDYLGDLWAGLAPGVDAGLDRYVDAVDGMLEGFRCGSTRGDASTTSTTPNRSKSQQKQTATANKFQGKAPSRLSL